jgi:hypothetical protein
MSTQVVSAKADKYNYVNQFVKNFFVFNRDFSKEIRRKKSA